MDVGNVHFDDGRFDGANAVAEGDARVRVGTGVQHDTVESPEASLLQVVDQFALDIALRIVDFHLVGVLLAKLLQKRLKRATAVDFRLATTQKIEVGTVQNQNFLHIFKNFLYFCRQSYEKLEN